MSTAPAELLQPPLSLERGYGVDSEYGRLTRVLLCAPDHLAMVPCNSVTREALRRGQEVSPRLARVQHAALRAALEGAGVGTIVAAASPALPDQVFARDTTLMTPWGLVGLRPGAFHRRGEVDHVLAEAEAAGVPVLGRIDRGLIEGGDICVLKPGLLVIGVTGNRTTEEGAEALASIFRRRGWRVMLHHFDPHFLHLDTILATAAEDLVLGCTDVLDDEFMAALAAEGVEIVPVSYKEARKLGCNVVALGERRVLTSADNLRVNADLAARGLEVITADVSQFTRCGGGVHCLTMPLARDAG